MSSSNEPICADSNNINTKRLKKIIYSIAFCVVAFYFFKFHNGLSDKNEVWGTFGDYVGGILNPVIAGFAFYLIAKTYDLQKCELKASRKLLKVSTEAQEDQIKLAALTATLNSNLTNIEILKSENIFLFKEIIVLEGEPVKVMRIKELIHTGSSSVADPDSSDYDEAQHELREAEMEYRDLVDNLKPFSQYLLDKAYECECQIKKLVSENNALKKKIFAFL